MLYGAHALVSRSLFFAVRMLVIVVGVMLFARPAAFGAMVLYPPALGLSPAFEFELVSNVYRAAHIPSPFNRPYNTAFNRSR